MVPVLRIFKMIATCGFLTALEYTKFVFGPPDPLAGLRGPTSKGEGMGGREERKRRREEEEKGRDRPPFSQIPGFTPGSL